MNFVMISRSIGPVPVSLIIREVHISQIGLTEIPIETGAKITDHAYIEPKKLELEFADEFAALTFNALVRFQETRTPFMIISGLTIYQNMMIRALIVERDEFTASVLRGRAELQEMIMVSTVSVPGSGPGSSQGSSQGPSSARSSSDQTAQQRLSGTVTRGDQAGTTIDVTNPANQSLADRAIFGSSGTQKVGPR